MGEGIRGRRGCRNGALAQGGRGKILGLGVGSGKVG